LDTNTGSSLKRYDAPHPLRKKVKRLAWSSRTGIADVPIWQVPIINLLWDGWNTHNLRLLSQGINMHAILVERTDMCTLNQSLRDRIQHANIDISALGKFL